MQLDHNRLSPRGSFQYQINQKKVQRKQQTYRDSYPSLVLITCEDSNQFDLGEKAKHQCWQLTKSSFLSPFLIVCNVQVIFAVI